LKICEDETAFSKEGLGLVGNALAMHWIFVFKLFRITVWDWVACSCCLLLPAWLYN
jgi:hypothetical protein